MKRITVLVLSMVIAGSTWWLGLVPTTPSYQLPSTDHTNCVRISLFGVSLYGSSDYARLAWMGSGGNQIDVVWPAGYWARFDPYLEVLDAGGHLVARDGSRVTSACLTDDRMIKFLDATSFPSEATT